MPVTNRGKRKQTIQDLEAARDIIEKYGWIQGDLGDTELGFCMVGAIDQRIYREEHDGNPDRFNRMYFALKSIINRPVAEWNDQEDRTQEEVIETFNKAIELVRNTK